MFTLTWKLGRLTHGCVLASLCHFWSLPGRFALAEEGQHGGLGRAGGGWMKGGSRQGEGGGGPMGGLVWRGVDETGLANTNWIQTFALFSPGQLDLC